jgi:hypothetical protein
VQMMEYLQPVALVGCQVLGLPPRWPGAAHDPPQPGGPTDGPAHQAGDLGDVLVVLHGAVPVHRGLPAAGGFACSPADGAPSTTSPPTVAKSETSPAQRSSNPFRVRLHHMKSLR